MKIVYEGDPNVKTFGEVGVGETFVYDECLFLKLETEGDKPQFNAVDLGSGETYTFYDKDEARAVRSKVIVYGDKV